MSCSLRNSTIKSSRIILSIAKKDFTKLHYHGNRIIHLYLEEPTPDQPSGNQEHYIPHRAVLKENAETTKLRIVYDCSSKESSDVPSLNGCLETAPPLQPRLFDILIHNPVKRLVITGDVPKDVYTD